MNRNKNIPPAILVFFLSGSYSGTAQPSIPGLSLKTFGVKINVTDMRKALHFYHDLLNFSVDRITTDSNTVFLNPGSGEEGIILNKVSYLLPTESNEAGATLTLQVNDLDSAINNLKLKGLDFGNNQIRKEGVGFAIYVNDPFGTRLSMMHETVVKNPHFNEPRIYNYGFYVSDMEVCKKFYVSQLGFLVRSEKYLPLDLPFNNADGSFGFMLHTRNGVKPIHYNSADNQHIVLLFQSPDLNGLLRQMNERKVQLAADSIQELHQGKTISFYDPFGYVSQAIEIKN